MFRSILACSATTLLGAAILTAAPVLADDAQNHGVADRPRIGLVLGGGGARGAAHIGVLQELQRLQVPIDAIAGTSMGAIVGGLYASGMSPDELEELVSTLHWSEAMSDSPPRTDLTFRRKQDDVLYPIDLELGVRDGGLVLPKGMVQGQNLGLLLRDLTADVAHITDYDALPIPLRIVASDIETGEAHVMGSGDLAWSIRASMSVPGFIAPVNLDDRLLVDGGIVANLPIDVIRTMDVDIIIAVDVEFPLYPPEELQSATAITEQMLTILMRKETQKQIASLQPEDVLIQPQLGTFASSNFAGAAEAVAKGRESVSSVEHQLRMLSVDEQTYAMYVAGLKPAASAKQMLSFVRIDHDDAMATALLAARIGVFAGDEFDASKLAGGANRLYNLGIYEQVNYQVLEEDGAIGVVYNAVPKSWGPDFLKVGLSVQDDLDGSTAFNVFGRLTKTGINRRGAEWRTDFEMGTDLTLLTEFYQPFGDGLKYFFAPRLDLWQRDQNLFIDYQSVAQMRVAETDFGLDLGIELGTLGEFRMGAYTGSGKTRVKIGDPAIPGVDYDLGGVFAQFRMDTLDDSRFPRSGIQAGIKWDLSRESLGASKDFEIFSADFLSAWSRGKSTLQFAVSFATSSDAEDQPQEYFPLGGFLRLSGLERGQISGPHAAMGRLVYYRLVSDYTGGLFEVPVYLGASIETGNVWQTRSDISFDSTLTSGSLFVAFDTYFGAIYVAAGFSEGGNQAYYLLIGSPPRSTN